MAYTTVNPKTKKELKEYVARLNQVNGEFLILGDMFNATRNLERGSEIAIEGPQSPEPHRWYARVIRKEDGTFVVK